jgi:hypothetical protein
MHEADHAMGPIMYWADGTRCCDGLCLGIHVHPLPYIGLPPLEFNFLDLRVETFKNVDGGGMVA